MQVLGWIAEERRGLGVDREEGVLLVSHYESMTGE